MVPYAVVSSAAPGCCLLLLAPAAAAAQKDSLQCALLPAIRAQLYLSWHSTNSPL